MLKMVDAQAFHPHGYLVSLATLVQELLHLCSLQQAFSVEALPLNHCQGMSRTVVEMNFISYNLNTSHRINQIKFYLIISLN